MAQSYTDFLRAKVKLAEQFGFEVSPEEINPILKPHQKDCVRWAVGMGRAALFEAFGLGKSIQQIEIVRLTLKKLRERGTIGRGLIVIPLGVRQEFVRDAGMLGVRVKFIRRIEEADDPDVIYLTNYETVRDGKLDPRHFAVASLDEASCLRGFGGTKTFREFMALFAGDRKTMNERVLGEAVPYRFVATATPSPNNFIELLAYAAFLGVMDVGQAKTRFFRRNSEKADELTIHPHKLREFWMWVASWAIFIQRPSDICRCPCHNENSSKESDSAGLSSSRGRQAHGVTEHGSVGAIAGIPDSQPQPICSKDETYRADVPDRNTAAKEPGYLQSGNQCSTAAAVQRTRIGRTTAAEVSECANTGSNSPTSETIWESQGPIRRSTASTTMATTSQATADGQAGSTKPETGGCGEKKLGRGASTCCDTCRCDDGYELPEMEIHWHEIPADHSEAGFDSRGQGMLLKQQAIGVVDSAREKRESLSARIVKMQELRSLDPAAHRILWHDLEAERRAIEDAIPDAVSVYGSQDLDERERAIIDFSDGKIRELAAKPVIAGSGCNFQRHCAWAIFLGIGFKFNDLIQAIHRLNRFLQTRRVRIDLIYTESEREVRRILEEKWAKHNEMVATMTEIIREYGLSNAAMAETLRRSMGVERIEVSGRDWRIVNNDCVPETAAMPENGVDLVLTSVPFSTQYEYSPNYADFGHSDNNEHFFRQMDFLTPHLLRVLRPGRIAAIHVKDRIVPGGLTGLGFQTVYPFHARCIEHYTRHGFGYMGVVTIVTDVVRENNQTYRLGWSEVCKDGTKMSCGMPEYLLLFRKPPSSAEKSYADTPVTHGKDEYSRSRWQTDAHGFWRSGGNRLLTPEELERLDHDVIFRWFRDYHLANIYDYEHHVKIGETIDATGRLPVTFMLLQPPSWMDNVWTDIARMRTLNMLQSAKGKEQHLCPLQFDIVDRVIERFTNRGETVYDPFGGIMSVPYRAILNGRKAVACELSTRYFMDGAYYLQAAEREMSMPTLFDIEHKEAVA